MEKDTVILSTKDYNELRDIKKAVDEKKKILFTHGWSGGTADYMFADKEDLEQAFVKENEQLHTKIKRLHNEIYDLKHPDRIQPSLDEVKKMTWWQFRKWKRG